MFANLSNLTNNASNTNIPLIRLVMSYIPLAIIFMGLIGNCFSFIIFRFDKNMKKISFGVYLSVMSITDTLSLFVFNLDNYLMPNFGLGVEHFGIVSCKIFSFMQFFALQSSGYLLCFTTIDRYVSVVSKPGSIAYKLPFRTAKSAVVWSMIIIFFVSIINSHLLIFNETMIKDVRGVLNRSFYSNVTKRCYFYPNGFKVSPLLDKLNLVLYSLLPSLIIITFNGLLLRKSLTLAKNKSKTISKRKKFNGIISLFVLSLSFIVMTAPTSIFHGFANETYLNSQGRLITICFDCIGFLHSSSLFFTCFITNNKFRQAFYNRFNLFSKSIKYNF